MGGVGTAKPALQREERTCEPQPLWTLILCGLKGVSKNEERSVEDGTWGPFGKARPKVRELHPVSGPGPDSINPA